MCSVNLDHIEPCIGYPLRRLPKLRNDFVNNGLVHGFWDLIFLAVGFGTWRDDVPIPSFEGLVLTLP